MTRLQTARADFKMYLMVLLKDLEMSAIKVAGMATSRADPGKVLSLLKDPVTWPLWSMFKSGELQRPGRGERTLASAQSGCSAPRRPAPPRRWSNSFLVAD